MMSRNKQIGRGAVCVITAGMFFAGCMGASAEDSAAAKPGEVVVSATRAGTALKDLGVSASVVTSDVITELDAQDIADALREVTGLRVTTYGSAGSLSEVSVRGSSSAQVLVLVDGRRMNKTSDGSVDFSVYKPSDIERIEVLRGPVSMLHGANAMAGVINIVTRGVAEKPSTSLSAEFGTFNTQSYRFSTSRKVGDVGVRISAGHSTSDGDRDNSQSDGYHVIGRVEHNVDGASSVLSAGYTTLDAGLPGSTNYPSPSASQDDERSWVDFTHRHTVLDSVELTAKLFVNDNTLGYADTDLDINDAMDNTQYGADLQAEIPIGERNDLVAGVYFERGQVQVRDKAGVSRIGGQKELDSYAVFIQDEFHLSDVLTITPAIRYDEYYGIDSEVSPRVSARFYATGSTALKTSFGRGFRPPTVNDLYWQDSFAVGNEDLKAERSVSWDVGVEQECCEGTFASVSYFSSDVEDLVAWEPRDSDGLWSPFNIDKAEIRGLELEVTSKLRQDLSFSLAYTWMQTENKGEYSGKDLQYKPEHRASCRLSYRSKGGLSASVALAYTDKVYFDQSNTETLDSYLLLDARVAKKICDNTEVFVSGRNLLDEEYTVINGYPMPGTTVNAGIEVVF